LFLLRFPPLCRVHVTQDMHQPSNERAAASSSTESSPRGNRCPYTSIVIMIDECPSLS